MDEASARDQAQRYFEEAYAAQMKGDLETAVTCYQKSIECLPTAEAHTFLGWTYSFRGDLPAAIRECCAAIRIDPDFGNPYNDIGVYLMQQGKLDEALPWLEKAKRARRYEPRQFPFMNTARIHLKQGRWWAALREFEAAVRVAPDDKAAHQALHSLRARLN